MLTASVARQKLLCPARAVERRRVAPYFVQFRYARGSVRVVFPLDEEVANDGCNAKRRKHRTASMPMGSITADKSAVLTLG